jgi:DegV family protein with EDD domain
MSSIKIVTDSTTDLPKEMLMEYGIEVIPLSVYVDGNSYLDNVTITPNEFLQKMQDAKELPKTSQPSTGVFLEAYNRLGANGDTIISIHMTSGMSGTYASALSAAEMSSSHVIVIDSQMISQGLGFQVVEAAEMARNGQSSESIVNRMKEILQQTSLYVVVLKLDNLIKGGRIGRASGWIGTLLNLKPIAMLKDGVYTPITRVRSTSQIITTLIERFTEDIKDKLVQGIGISHANNLPLAEKLQHEIAKITNIPVRICPATPVITTHTGAGAIGFMYYATND